MIQQKKRVQKPEVARIKCVVDFVDGNSLTMYSLDSFYSYHYKASITDESKGFDKLQTKLDKWKDRIVKADFYISFADIPLTSAKNYNCFVGKFIGGEYRMRHNWGFDARGKVNLYKMGKTA